MIEARIQVDQLEQIVQEHLNAYHQAPNGDIEATLKQVMGILCTNKVDLEKHLQKEVPLDHPVMTWPVEYAAWMVNVRVVGANGMVAFERVRRRPFHKLFLPFGELVNVHLLIDVPERA